MLHLHLRQRGHVSDKEVGNGDVRGYNIIIVTHIA